MNSQYSIEIQNAYASQAHQRALNEASDHRLQQSLSKQSARSRVSAKAKVILAVIAAALLSIAGLASAAADVISSGGGNHLVY